MSERPRSAKIPEAAFASVIHAYLQSPKFNELAESTQIGYRQYLRLAELPEVLGAKSVNVIHPSDVQLFLDELADRPGAQQRARVALGAVERWAIKRRLLPFPITLGVELEDSEGGHIPWPDTHIELAERHAWPDYARIVTLGVETGQRGSDLCRMCPTDLEEFRGVLGINVRQRKTGLPLWIPISMRLRAEMALWKRQPGPFLRQPDGSAWESRLQMSNGWNAERDRNPALKPLRSVSVTELPEPRNLVLHGLRATACRRLWNRGCPTTLISNRIGMSLPMVERYVRFGNQKDSALASMRFMDETSTEQIASTHPKNQMAAWG
jgi:integrase